MFTSSTLYVKRCESWLNDNRSYKDGRNMVKVGLQIKATLENIDELKTSHPNYTFFLKVKCTNCGEASEKWHDLTEADTVNEDSRNPKGFNFFMKCKLCSRENSIDILQGSNGM